MIRFGQSAGGGGGARDPSGAGGSLALAAARADALGDGGGGSTSEDGSARQPRLRNTTTMPTDPRTPSEQLSPKTIPESGCRIALREHHPPSPEVGCGTIISVPEVTRTSHRLTVADHDRDATGQRCVYAVVSRRARGVSVGVNLNPNNACNWRCIYCRVPDLTRGLGPAIDLPLLGRELDELLDDIVDGDFLVEDSPDCYAPLELTA
ncbi:MAG: hypothetical protein R3B72_38890 [Polyangiaceae bacterium]